MLSVYHLTRRLAIDSPVHRHAALQVSLSDSGLYTCERWERCALAWDLLYGQGKALVAVAKRFGVSPSTITRDLQRFVSKETYHQAWEARERLRSADPETRRAGRVEMAEWARWGKATARAYELRAAAQARRQYWA